MRVLMLLLLLLAMMIITATVRYCVLMNKPAGLFSGHKKVLSHQSYADAGGTTDPLTVQCANKANDMARTVEVKARDWIYEVHSNHVLPKHILSDHPLTAKTRLALGRL